MATAERFINKERLWAASTEARSSTDQFGEATESLPPNVIVFPGGVSLTPSRPSVASETERRFRRLADGWLADTALDSDPVEKFLHPLHLKIIGLGEKALPSILKEVEKMSGHWFVALDAISWENPVRPEDEMSLERTAQAWLVWGRGKRLL
jgi:hypothetical protein